MQSSATPNLDDRQLLRDADGILRHGCKTRCKFTGKGFKICDALLRFITMTHNYKPPIARRAFIIFVSRKSPGMRKSFEGCFFFFETPFGACGGRASFINLGTMFSWNIHCCFLIIIMFWTNKAAEWKAFLICFLIFFPNAALLIHLDADQINEGVACPEQTHASPT